MRHQNTDDIRILDIGSGPGYYTVPISVLGLKNWKVYALDIRIKMLQILMRRVSNKSGSSVLPIQSSAVKLPFTDATFDAVLLCLVLGEIVDQSVFVLELQRILKPNGIIYIYETVFDDHFMLFEESIALMNGFEVELIEQGRTFYLAQAHF